MYNHIMYNIVTHFPSPLFPHCSTTMRFLTKKLLKWPVSSLYIYIICYYCYILTFSNVMDCLTLHLASSELYIHVGYYHLIFLHLPVSGIVACFTRTTSLFTVIIVVCSLESMCVPCFIVIGYCVSELHAHYCNILPEAVYCIVYKNFYTFV